MTEILFSSVKDAVRWSQEVLSIPDCQSQLGKLILKPGTGLTRVEVRDIAHSISLITINCKAPTGETMFAVYAGHDTERDLWVGRNLGGSSDVWPRLSKEQLYRLGYITVKAHRAKELYGDRYPLKRMAYDMGVQYDHFRRNRDWQIARLEMVETITAWMDQAEREIYPELESRGWIA